MPDFNVWVAGDSHVGTDIKRNRRSLAEALTQSEQGSGSAPAFAWDIMLDVGDLAGGQLPPDDHEGQLVLDQYSVLREHQREQIYNVAGNHDASGPDEETQWWFRKYVDPLGQSTTTSGIDASRRPFKIEGTWERYRFLAGNVLFLMMSDRNDGGPPVGRSQKGGYPSGAVTGETFDWWVQQVQSNQDKIIVSVHHHMLKETTVGSGPWEGYHPPDAYGRRQGKYHGYFPDGGPMGASYLYWVDGHPDAQAFERYLASHPGCIDLWLGGHTHIRAGESINGRSHIENKWGVTFVNCAALTSHHHNGPHQRGPMSRLLRFTPGSDELAIGCYLHSDDVAPAGWHEASGRRVKLKHAFAGV